VKEFLDLCKETAHKKGFALTLTGRRRPIPELLSQNPSIRSLGERLAVNTPLQGGAADLIKIVMIELEPFLLKHQESIKMLLQVHDELLFEIQEEKKEEFIPLIKQKMEGSFPLKVPLLVDLSIGKNWGAC
jgi:DNA polymerase-1